MNENTRLKKFLNEINISPHQLSIDMQQSKSTAAKWLNPNTKIPHHAIAYLMQNYSLNPKWLLFGIGEMQEKDYDYKQFVQALDTIESNVAECAEENADITAELALKVYTYFIVEHINKKTIADKSAIERFFKAVLR